MNQSKTGADSLSWIILFGLSLIWGASFILIKKSLVAFEWYDVAVLRIGISFLAFLPYFLLHFKKYTWSKWKWFLLIGLAGNGIPAFLFPLAETQISSALAGILNSMTPIFTLILGVSFFGVLATKRKYLGVLLGFIGALLLILQGSSINSTQNPWYSLFVILACLCYALNTNLVKRLFVGIRPMDLSAVTFILIGPWACIYILGSDIPNKIFSHPDGYASLLYVSILALFGSVLAIVLFYELISRTNPVFASSVAYIMPIVALGFGILDGESVTAVHLIGLIIILIGVNIIRREPTN